jgi:hypothetical protein
MTWAPRIVAAFVAGHFTERDHELAMHLTPLETDDEDLILSGHFYTSVCLDSPREAARYYVEIQNRKMEMV